MRKKAIRNRIAGEKPKTGRRYFPHIDKSSRFYKNCKRQRRLGAKICGDCPFREDIEALE